MALADLGIGMDQYDRNARLKPALLVILPAALAVIALGPESVLGWSGGIALIVQAGGSFLLAQIVGDVGKKKEPALFEYFGGRPTERLLHHAHAPNKVLLGERHRKLAKLFPKMRLPTPEQEEKDSKAASDMYTACVDKLRGMARADKEKFPHVYRENIHYGFRRNLWAVKPYGAAVAVIATVVVCAEMVGRAVSHEQIHLAQPVIVGVNGLFIPVWIIVVTRRWVQRAATLYAERLLEVLDV